MDNLPAVGRLVCGGRQAAADLAAGEFRDYTAE
jgi:hypothetical protein